MKVVNAGSGGVVSRPGAFGILLPALLLASSPRAAAQCIASPPTDFHVPFTFGGPRPVSLSAGFNSNLALFRAGAGGPWRMLMEESFGYSIFDLSNPASPGLPIRWDYIPGDANKVPIAGDGQSYIQTIAVTADGQRVAFSLTGPAAPWNSIVGSPDGSFGWTMWGDTAPTRGSATVLQTIGGRYLHYGMDVTTGVYVADVTTLPGSFAVGNVPFQVTGWPAGYSPTLTGNYLAYMSSAGVVQLVDVSHPGPAGSITNAMPRTTIGSAAFGGRTLNTVQAAVDPGNPSKVWLLVELYAAAGENSPSYGLVSVTQDVAGTFAAPVSAGPLFRVPSVAGESWSVSGASSSLATINGTVHVLMWATRRVPSFQYVLHATSVGAWGTGTYANVISNPSFTVATGMSVLPWTGNTAYAYLASGLYTWVLPMTCVPPNAKATTILSAVNASNGGAAVASADAVPYGDQLTFTPTILPPTSFQSLTGWGWNFDFDFHAGSLIVEDAGVGATPRLKNSDADALVPPNTLPTSVTLVGPCDPRAGGVPATGAGCWNSVRTNGSQTAGGAPDFSGAEAPGATTPLAVAFEANNANGSLGPALFTVNWKRPAVGLASTSILAGDALTASADGHPQSGGANVWKWWFDGALQACASATCLPSGAYAAAGTHTFWVTAPYAQIGYSTPDFAGAPMGTYAVTNYAPAFTVNGSATGPVVATLGSPLSVVNSSRRGAAVSGNGGYLYSLCQVPGGQTTCADNYVAFPAMTDAPPSGAPPTSATIPNPGAGTWLLKLRVNYTNPAGTAYWPSPAGTSGITVTVPNPVVVTAGASPNPASSGSTVLFTCSATGGTGTGYTYAWTGAFGITVATTASFTLPVTNNTGSPRVDSFTCSVTDSGGTSGFADVNLTVRPRPVASAGASPSPATSGATVAFACSASGGTGTGYAYVWTGPGGGTVATSASFNAAVTNVSGAARVDAYTCTVTDSGGGSGSANVTLTVYPKPAAAAGAAPNPAIDGASVTFSCSASGGAGGYAYQWFDSLGQTLAYTPAFTYAAVNKGASDLSVPATCSVADAAGGTASALVSLVVRPPGPYALYTVTPCRVFDTRTPAAAPALQPAGSADRSFPVASACGIPADAKAVSANVTVANVQAAGTLSIYRGDGARTGTTTTAFRAGTARANNAFLQLALDGSGTIRVQNLAPGTVDLVIDVNGYFR